MHADDLTTPDGKITSIQFPYITVVIENISPLFVGYDIPQEQLCFNIKSTLAQLGLDGHMRHLALDKGTRRAEMEIELLTIGPLARKMASYLEVGAYIGKLFAADLRRRVRDPDYLARMFGRSDRLGQPLLSLGGLHDSQALILDKVEGRAIAYLTLQNGRLTYDAAIVSLLPTLAKALLQQIPCRDLLKLHQIWNPDMVRHVAEDELLLVRTPPLHIRTVYGRVVNALVSHGYHHTSANILQPDTQASGDVYEFYGNSKRELTDVPLEFYTLEPHREYVFFQDRDQLQSCLEDAQSLFKAFSTSPEPASLRTATFIVKGTQLVNLKPEHWIVRQTRQHAFPGQFQERRQALMIERYIEQQPTYPILKAIADDEITSQGILLCRYFPSPLMKRMLLSYQVQQCLKRIYFEVPSLSCGDFFSAEDRALLHDLEKFAIPTFWVDRQSGRILQYIQKPEKDSGMFVPLDKIETFLKATLFGLYGSNLNEGDFADELRTLLQGVQKLCLQSNHPLLNSHNPIAFVTGGGPGAMAVGNRIAQELSILSCANIVDFSKPNSVINEQLQNPHIEAKMTYRIDKLVERQAEFNLDFPLFFMGGIGTDFEYALEEVRRKVGAVATTPILLFGSPDYWRAKITTRFAMNLKNGTIRGSEWISNSFFCVQTAAQGLEVYRRFAAGTLPIGPGGPVYPEGFIDSTVLDAH